MRRVTRNFVLAVCGVVVVLLALGSVPGLLGSGDPYYVTATPVDDGQADDSQVEGNATANASQEAVDAANLSERAYPYTTAALDDATANESGRSDPYREGPIGVKEAFTHSPFDELDALRQQYPNATVDGGVSVNETGEASSGMERSNGVRVSRNGTLYRVAVTR